MIKRLGLAVVLLVVAGGARAGTSSGKAEYVWPLSYRGCLTSSFAEYRQGHFHAGIDLSTGGKTGFKVRAVANGELYRLRTSPFGYGKAVYILLPDGKIAVYAHLSDFAPGILRYVEEEQARTGSYSVDIRLPRGAFPVAAGEVIGYSGQTGVGSPHLHFEMREGEDVPVNPLRHGFAIQDDVPPTIRSVVLTPLESDARVDGSIRPLTIAFEWSPAELCFRTDRTVRIEGPVGVMILCDDCQAACDQRFGVFSIDLRVDEEIAYRSRFDRFSYDKSGLVGIEYDEGMIGRGGGTYHRLYTAATNLLPFTLTDRRHAGVIVGSGRGEYGEGIVLSEGLHYIEAVASDANGNNSHAVLGLVVGAMPEIRRAQVVDDDEVTVFLDGSPGEIGDFVVSRSLNGGRHWESRNARYAVEREAWLARDFPGLSQRMPLLFRVDVATLTGAHRRPLFLYRNYESLPTPEPEMDLRVEHHADAALVVLEIDRAYPYRVEARVFRDNRSPLRLVMEQVEATRYEGIISLRDIESETAWVTVSLGGAANTEWSSLEKIRAVRVPALLGGEVRDEEGMAAIRLPSAALVRDTYFRVEKEEGPPLERGLSYISPVYRFEPASALLRDNATIKIRPFAPGVEGKGVALYRMDTHGRWRHVSGRVDPNRPEFTVSTSSLSRYALIRDEAPPSVYGLRPSQGAVIANARPRLQAKVSDIGSDFEAEDVQIFLDGRHVIAEYDPERELIFYGVKSPLAVGSHRFAVVATDRAGNSSKSEATFYVSGE
ncbi:MAG: M23 family metallopeptidase [Candidatus Eisenbacteria bacterium]